MKRLRLPAFAKINLCLDILEKRADGYHELRTIFQSIALHDTLALEITRGGAIELRVLGDPALSAEPIEQNLVYRAVEMLRRELGITSGARIELRKEIPAGRGLGGGSSDAAAALIGFLRLTRKRLPAARLVELAACLGADVPFFLFGGRAVGVSRGDEVYPLPDLRRRAVLVVSPREIAVKTADAYRWVSESRARRELTNEERASKLWRFCTLCWSLRAAGVSNDFEAAVFPRHSRLDTIRGELLRRGATEAALAGSGSAVFGLFRDPAQARRAARAFPDDRVFVSNTLSRVEYRRAQGGPDGF